MKLEEYISSLPGGIVSGDDVSLPRDALRRMMRLARVGSGDSVCHLGCGDGEALEVALGEFGASSGLGIDSDPAKIAAARRRLHSRACRLECGDAGGADVSDTDVVIAWFADEDTLERISSRLASLREGARVVTVWGAPPGCLPDRVDFPFIASVAPFRRARSVREQLLAVLGVKCVDFVTAWEYSERYARALAGADAASNRFLTIIQAVTMWINARNLGVSCTDEMPESIRTYAGILETFFGIEVGHLLGGSGAAGDGRR